MPIAPLLIPLISAGVQTVANVVGSIHDRNVAKRNTNLTVRENQKLAKYAYEQEQQNINAQNVYNSPSEQMARFRKAGLNPALIYSQGTPGNQTGIAKYNAPRLEYNYKPGFKGSDWSPITDLGMKAQEIRNQIKQGRILDAQGTINEAIASTSQELAEQQLRIARGEAQLNNIKTVFGYTEFNKFFEKTGYNDYQLKPGMEEVFLEYLTAKYASGYAELGRTQASTSLTIAQEEKLRKELEFLNWGLPWAQPFLNFLRMLILKR